MSTTPTPTAGAVRQPTEYANRGGEIWENTSKGWRELFIYDAIQRLIFLESQIIDRETKLEQIKDVLADPNAVRINMLRGAIAWTPEGLRHVLGDMDHATRLADALDAMAFNWHNHANLSEQAHKILIERAKAALAGWRECNQSINQQSNTMKIHPNKQAAIDALKEYRESVEALQEKLGVIDNHEDPYCDIYSTVQFYSTDGKTVCTLTQ